MSTVNNTAIVNNATKDGAREIGPFNGTDTPVRPGLYRRISKRTGRKLWSFWNGNIWSRGTNNLGKAKSPRFKNKRSKFQSQPWFGLDREVKA